MKRVTSHDNLGINLGKLSYNLNSLYVKKENPKLKNLTHRVNPSQSPGLFENNLTSYNRINSPKGKKSYTLKPNHFFNKTVNNFKTSRNKTEQIKTETSKNSLCIIRKTDKTTESVYEDLKSHNFDKIQYESNSIKTDESPTSRNNLRLKSKLQALQPLKDNNNAFVIDLRKKKKQMSPTKTTKTFLKRFDSTRKQNEFDVMSLPATQTLQNKIFKSMNVFKKKFNENTASSYISSTFNGTLIKGFLGDTLDNFNNKLQSKDTDFFRENPNFIIDQEFSKYTTRENQKFLTTKESLHKVGRFHNIVNNQTSTPNDNNLNMMNTQTEAWTNKQHNALQLKPRVLKELHLEANQCSSFYFKTKNAMYPIKVKIFSENFISNINIAFSFIEIPDFHNNTDIRSGTTLLIDKTYEEYDTRKKVYITVFSLNEIKAYIGVLFAGIKCENKNQKIWELEEEYRMGDPTAMLKNLEHEIEDEQDYIRYLVQGNKASEEEHQKNLFREKQRNRQFDNHKQLHHTNNRDCKACGLHKKHNNNKKTTEENRKEMLKDFDQQNSKRDQLLKQGLVKVDIEANDLNTKNIDDIMGYEEDEKTSVHSENKKDSVVSNGKDKSAEKLKDKSKVKFVDEGKNLPIQSEFGKTQPQISTKRQISKNEILPSVNNSKAVKISSPPKLDSYRRMEIDDLIIHFKNTLMIRLKKIVAKQFETSALQDSQQNNNLQNKDKAVTETDESKKQHTVHEIHSNFFQEDVSEVVDHFILKRIKYLTEKKNKIEIKEIVITNLIKHTDIILETQTERYYKEFGNILEKKEKGEVCACHGHHEHDFNKNTDHYVDDLLVVQADEDFLNSNKYVAQHWDKIREVKTLKNLLNNDLKHDMAKMKHRNERIKRQTVFENKNLERKRRRDAKIQKIKAVFDFHLYNICRRQWSIMIWTEKIQRLTDHLFKQKVLQKMSYLLESVSAIKIQRYIKKRLFWRLLINPQMMTKIIIKQSLTLFCSEVRKKTIKINFDKLASYQPKFLPVYRAKVAMFKYIEIQTNTAYSIKHHFETYKCIKHEFSKNFDKSVLKLVELEKKLINAKKTNKIYYNVSNFMHFLSSYSRDSLFYIVWNYELCTWLNKNYHEKAREKEEQKKKANKDNSFLLASYSQLGSEERDNSFEKENPSMRPLKKVIEFPEILGKIKKKSYWPILMTAKERYKSGTYDDYLSNFKDTGSRAFKRQQTRKNKTDFKNDTPNEMESPTSPKKKQTLMRLNTIRDKQKSLESRSEMSCVLNKLDVIDVMNQKNDKQAILVEKMKVMFNDQRKKFKLEYDSKFYDYLVITLVEHLKINTKSANANMSNYNKTENVMERAQASQTHQFKKKGRLADLMFEIAQNHITVIKENQESSKNISVVTPEQSKNLDESVDKKMTQMYSKQYEGKGMADLIISSNSPKKEEVKYNKSSMASIFKVDLGPRVKINGDDSKKKINSSGKTNNEDKKDTLKKKPMPMKRGSMLNLPGVSKTNLAQNNKRRLSSFRGIDKLLALQPKKNIDVNFRTSEPNKRPTKDSQLKSNLSPRHAFKNDMISLSNSSSSLKTPKKEEHTNKNMPDNKIPAKKINLFVNNKINGDCDDSLNNNKDSIHNASGSRRS